MNKVVLKIFINSLTIILFLLLIVFFVYNHFYDTSFGLFQNVILSSLGSLLFFILVFQFARPSLKISKHISRNKQFHLAGDNDVEDLRIKVVNTSLFRAIDISANLYEVVPITNNGQHYKFLLIHNLQMNAPFINGWLYGSWSKANSHAFQPNLIKGMSNENIKRIYDVLSDPQRKLLFTFHLRNSFSGISTTFNMEYDNQNCIQNGMFKSGNNLDIVPLTN